MFYVNNKATIVSSNPSMVDTPQPQYVECISKSFKFQCPKCSKRFRKLITSDLANSTAIDSLEDTLMQPQNCECQCPFCYNPQCNLLDINTQLVVGPWFAMGDEDIKEENEDDESAMKVTVEEDLASKQSKPVVAPVLLHSQTSGAKRTGVHESGWDVSLQNHVSQRAGELSPAPSEHHLSASGHHSLSPSRFSNSKAFFSSEVSADNNQNGSPTAQVTILKDAAEEGAFGDEPMDTASVSQSTTKVSAIKSKLTPQTANKKHHLVIQAQPKPADEEYNLYECNGFNGDLMRAMMSRKMAKQKTFYELKVQPQQPHLINSSSLQSPIRNNAQSNHVSWNYFAFVHFNVSAGANAVYMKTQRISVMSPPNVRRTSQNDQQQRNARFLSNQYN